MEKPRLTITAAMAAGLFLLAPGAAFASLYQLDFNHAGGPSPTQAGWIGVNADNRFDNGTSVSLGDEVTAAAVAWGTMSSRDRGTAGLPALGFDQLLQDFMNPAYTTSSFEVRGLAAGQYNVTLICGDQDYPENPDEIVLNGKAVNLPGFLATATKRSDISTTVQVTLNGIEPLSLAKASGFNGKLAGLIIEPVPAPEPATLGLLTLGGLGVLSARIRRRLP